MFARNVSADLKLNTLRQPDHMFEADVRPIVRKPWGTWREITTRREFKGRIDRCRAFVRECWQRMCHMKARFERSNAAYCDVSGPSMFMALTDGFPFSAGFE